jgi:hypothetical protein
MSLLFALLAALSNAVNVITQHVASTNDTDESEGWRFVWYLVRNPLWIFGGAALIGAFVFQAIAVVTCAAVSVFIVTAEPRGGQVHAASRAWALAIIACAATAGVLALFGTRGAPSRRAAVLAISSSVVWALEATFIKSVTDTLTEDGVVGSFLHWPVYAVAVGGVAGTVLTQAALHVGPLRASQPFLVIVDPLVSIVLSVYLFGEYFTLNGGDLIVASVSFTALCVSVVWLTRSAPETVERDL